MQRESMHSSSSGHVTHNIAVSQESPITSLQCSHCTLILKSKIFFFEHLNKEHGLSVDVALREAGLKKSGANEASADNSSSPGNNYQSHHSDLNVHGAQCQIKSEDQNVTGNPMSSENSQSQIHLTSWYKGDAEAMPTSTTNCTLNSSKDLKTYNRPLQTITKYSGVPSGSDGTPTVELDDGPEPLDGSKETLILEESPSDSSPTSSGVFKVTAKPMIDVTRCDDHFLMSEHLLIPQLMSPRPKAPFRDTFLNKVVKRSNNRSIQSPPPKKSKSEEDTQLQEKVNGTTQEKTAFSLEFSEDEEEKKSPIVNRDTESPVVRSCKHCDYSDGNISRLSAHYQNDHPYIRYKDVYIQDPCDQSATFRCLECPVEFISVVTLKKHYREKHPEAPDVFKMKSRELGLGFRCFVCSFVTNALTALEEHYKEKHPNHEMDNSLMYCRYSMPRCQEGASLLNKCEKAPSPERSQEICHQSAHTPCKEVQEAASTQHPTSKAEGTAIYHCKNCQFSHKSIIVMQVHYQRNHPDEAVTIHTIKQSTCVTLDTVSQIKPDKSPSSVTLKEKSTPPKNAPDVTKKTEKRTELFQQKEISLSVTNPQHAPEESARAQKVEPAEDRSKGQKSHTKSERVLSTGTNRFPVDLFYCQLCSYTSTKIKSIVNHNNSKHYGQVSIDTEQVLLYSANVQKKKRRHQPKASAGTASCDSKTDKRLEVRSQNKLQHEGDDAVAVSVTKLNLYACPEKLYYCQACNYGNTSAQGIINHQIKIHPNRGASLERVIQYTHLVRDEIEKSKSQAREPSFSTHLPLPLIEKGEEDALFCHLCNYRQSSVGKVLRHYVKQHRGFEASEEQVCSYTAMVLSKSEESDLKKTASQEVTRTPLGKTEVKTKTKKPGKVLASPSRPSETQRALQCDRCSYNNKYVYLLRRHIRKVHKSNRTVRDVLRMCFKQGALMTGCHCDLCGFSHKKASVVYEHYLEQHPGRKLSLNYVATHLYVGPKLRSPKKKKPKAKHTDGINDGEESEDTCGSIPPQSLGQNKSQTFSCRACSFKGSSMSSITHHYRAVHPWSVKEDGSVLYLINSKKHSANRPVQDESETPMSFDTYQEPLEFEQSPGSSHRAISSKTIKCPICPATFPTQHGLSVHCGMKHPGATPENVMHEQQRKQLRIQTRVHVFKCPHCSYVNTSYQGVHTHCQMRHPSRLTRVDSLYVDDLNLRDSEDCVKTKVPGMRVRGYMCKTCPHIYATAEKLNEHCRVTHNETVASMVPNKAKSVPTQSAVSEKKQVKTHSKGSLPKSFSLSKKKYAVISCQHCSYSCATKSALVRHQQFRHKNASVSKVPDCSYKCALCSNLYFKKSRLGMHYAKKHGREAFLKHYASVYKQDQKKPAPVVPDRASTRQKQKTSVACDSSATAKETKQLLYRCPVCPYVNVSLHGALTHCQMKHPEVIARGDELLTEEVLLSNIAGGTLGKGSNLGGYACETCPRVLLSLKGLKTHCDKDHQQAAGAASDRPVETEPENQPEYGCEDSKLEMVPLKSKTPTASTTTAETCPPTTPPSRNMQVLYKCSICTYTGSCRKYLYTHLRNTHKLDRTSSSKLLEKYNKYKRSLAPNQSLEGESEQSTCVECKLCPDLKFDSCQLLIAHYGTFHRSNCKLDFIVLSQGSKKTTGLYKCALCSKHLNGIRKLCRHLDHHRETERHLAKAAKAAKATPEDESFKSCGQEVLPSLQTVEERSRCDGTPETLTVPQSPLSSPSRPTDPEQPDVESTKDKVVCTQCGRSFRSLKGLRSHERSHAALAAIKKLNNLSTSGLKQNINKYVLFRDGTTRPFRCSLCSYKTGFMGLWRGHFLKNHQDVIMDTAETDHRDEESAQEADEEPFILSEEVNNLPEYDEEPEITEKSLYLEPPDVQRQLNQYTLMTRAGAPHKVDVEETKFPGSRLLHCELCNFNTGHLSSMRRHYLNRHGKKILRCKDCNFFTGLRKTLEMHMEMGHSTCPSEPTHEKDLRCPFCLYKTKNKNNMIDHIVLHREERVVPIEVRRLKLSRYLRGLVFRCHKCTFTSGSAENLRLHMAKHDDVKPYKCRLCYFDCAHLSDLEAHLSDKHQVLRNHELVGQISLDKLDARVGRMPEEEGEPSFDNEHPNDGCDDVTTEEFVTDCNDFPLKTKAENLAENDIGENVVWKIKEENENEGRGGVNRSEESPAKISASHLHCENTEPNTAVQATLEQDAPGLAFSPNHANIAEKEIGDGNNVDIQYEVCDFPGEDRQTNENQAQSKVRESQDSSVTLTRQHEEAANGISVASGKLAEEKRDRKFHMKALKHRTVNTEARIEDDILRHVLQLDEGGGTHKIHKKADCDRTVKIENSEPKAKDCDLHKIPSLDEDGSITSAHSQTGQDKTEDISTPAMANHKRVNNISSQQHFTVEKHLLTLGPACRQLKISHKGILSMSSTIGKETQAQNQKNRDEEVRVPHGEMPAIKNERLKGEPRPLGESKEEGRNDHQEQQDEMITEGEKSQCTNLENRESDRTKEASDGLTGADGASAKEKPFTCEFCGRNLMNSSELERHIIRHVM